MKFSVKGRSVKGEGLAVPKQYRALTLVAVCVLAGHVLSFVCHLVGTQSFETALVYLISCSPRELATALFLALVVLLLTGLTHSLFFAGLLTSLASVGLCLADYYKTLITSTPLAISDLSLVTNLGNIMELNSSSIRVTSQVAIAVGIVVLLLVGLYFLTRSLRLNWGESLAAFLVSAAVFLGMFCIPSFANDWFYAVVGVPSGEEYSQSQVNAETGVVLGLWRSFSFPVEQSEPLPVDELELAIRDAMEYIDSVPTGGVSEETPHVIFVLSESFFDPETLEGVEYESDPIPDYRRACEGGVSGTFYTHTLGYGTSNIELEIMTGINGRFLATDDMIYKWDREKLLTVPAMPLLFQRAGYYTAYIHTFNDDIYNRSSYYPSLGFGEMFFSGDFAEIDSEAAAADYYWGYMESKISGQFYSDDYMAELIIDLFEREREAAPVFLWAITMENHTPFTADKYAEYNHPFTSELDDAAAGVLASVTEGIANSSAALGKLMDYFEQVDEPVILVFFGDHKPGLPVDGSAETVYSELGMASALASEWDLETRLSMYSTDYVIWANDESLLPAEAGTRRDSSSTTLGLQTMLAAGLELDDYWRMCAVANEAAAAYTSNFFVAADGSTYERIPGSLDEESARKLDIMTMLMRDTFSGAEGPTFYNLEQTLAQRLAENESGEVEP